VKDRVLRAFLIEEQRIVRKVLQAESKYQRDKSRREKKNKKRLEKKKATEKKVGIKVSLSKGTGVTKQSGKTVGKAAPAAAKKA
ncbi:hypothetical protein, partial [Vibrio cholerae]|uniref:hypothetical protein n=1 Tax=Vibrio cholerae TaxID=666 RepID=UPI0018F07377